MLRYVEIALVLLILGASLFMLWESSGWGSEARLFPSILAIPLALACVAQLVTMVRSPAALTPHAMDRQPLESVSDLREAIRLVVWIGVFVLAIALFSIPLGLTVGTLLYLKMESRESWKLSLTLSAATLAYLYVIFDYGLHLPWPEGIVSSLLLPA